MNPTIGRIVIYTVGGADDPCYSYHIGNGTQELPAVIVKVWSPTSVNLKVFTDGPYDFHLKSVAYSEKPGPFGRTWRWPERT